MTEKNQDMLEQNKRINELTRKVGRLEQTMNTLEHAIEPSGWISQAFLESRRTSNRTRS